MYFWSQNVFGLGSKPLLFKQSKTDDAKHILDNSNVAAVCGRNSKAFSVSHENASVHKTQFIQKWFSQFVVKEIDRPAQNANLNSIQHLWDGF